jgi:nucleoside 2-deoxyribosyltransferase
MACLLHERVLKGLGDCPIGFRMAHDGDSTDGEYGVLHDYDKWIDAFPQTPLEHIDRALLNVHRHISREKGFFTGPFEIAIDSNDLFCCRTLFCSPRQADDLLEMMANMGYVGGRANRRSGADPLTVKLKPGGLQRIADLQAGQSETSDTCFVAMAYHTKTDAYRGAVRSAIEQAGYRADVITVDEGHHNDFIMDRVINMIDDARFVIADLTVLPEIPPEHDEDETEKAGKVRNGVRGGVYWEAGYAKGRGKEVIYTCNVDDQVSENRIHFDIEQIVRIKWKKDQLHEFTQALASRIVATVGKGPHYKG